MNIEQEQQNLVPQRSEKTATIPLGYWEVLARAYWKKEKTSYEPDQFSKETVTVPSDIFWRVSEAYYSEPKDPEPEEEPDAADADETSPTPHAQQYRAPDLVSAVPKGRLARLASNAIQPEADEKPEETS